MLDSVVAVAEGRSHRFENFPLSCYSILTIPDTASTAYLEMRPSEKIKRVEQNWAYTQQRVFFLNPSIGRIRETIDIGNEESKVVKITGMASVTENSSLLVAIHQNYYQSNPEQDINTYAHQSKAFLINYTFVSKALDDNLKVTSLDLNSTFEAGSLPIKYLYPITPTLLLLLSETTLSFFSTQSNKFLPHADAE